MSASRTITSRKKTRREQSLPYARPPQKAATSWSFSNILKYIIPYRSQEPEEDSYVPNSHYNTDLPSFNEGTGDVEMTTSSPPPPSPRTEVQAASRLPKTPVKASDAITRPPDNLETVSNFLADRAEKGISGSEVEHILSIIQKCTPPENNHRIFRFTSSTPSVPLDPNLTTTHRISTPAGTPSASPRKTLSKNPNGVYRWEGAGSAKQSRSRNRYASPAFGASRSTPERLVMKESASSSKEPRSDSKRRKVSDESHMSVKETSSTSETSTNGSLLPFPASSPTTVSRPNGTAPKLIVPSTPSRLRTPAVQKPTTPVVPSPLRQAWSDASSPSQNDVKQSPQPQRPSKAANFMAELIKEVTPPRKPDVSNPYQTASPVSKVGPPRRANKRLRATGKPTVPSGVEKKSQERDIKVDASNENENEKQKEYSPQAIIEATVPKGSKRSRPPAHFERSPSLSASSSASSSRLSPSPQHEHPVVIETRKVTYVVEEPDDDDDETHRKAKKSKPSTNNGGSTSKPNLTVIAPSPDIIIEEVDDVDMEESTNSTTAINASSTARSVSPTTSAPRTSFSFKSTSAPKEPSKLRFSYQPEGGSTAMTPSSAPAPAFNFATSAASSAFTFAAPKEQKVDAADDKNGAQKSDPKAKARMADASSLPTFVFACNVTSVFPSSPAHVRARNAAKSLPLSSLPTFDFSARGLDNANASASGSSTSTLSNPAPATNNYFTSTVSDIPKAPPKAFDWSAAGVKPPPAASGSSWTCSLCGLANPATATEKCGICENPR